MRSITIVPIGGLGNRILSISSFISYCREIDVKLKIGWVQDSGLASSFSSLFDTSGLDNVEIKEISGLKRFVSDFPRKTNLWIPPCFQRFIYDKRIYQKEFIDIRDHSSDSRKNLFQRISSYKNIYIVTSCGLFEESTLQIPSPSKEVMNLFNKITADFDSDMIGIHIRRTDNSRSIASSPTELYIGKMNEELDRNPNVKFYVASDSLEEKKRLKELFPERVITFMNEVRRDSHSGILFAFAEILALAGTKRIYASKFSTFAIVANKMSEGSICLF